MPHNTHPLHSLPEPVVVWLDPARPEFGTTIISTVPDGLAALNRHGIDGARHGPHAQLWQEAAAALSSAKVEPSPGNLRRAFDTMLRLVKRVAPVPTRVRVLSAPRGLRERVQGLLAPSGLRFTAERQGSFVDRIEREGVTARNRL